MASLRVNVQADRLPDVGGNLQISVRVTAAVEGITADPLPTAAVDQTLPWKWQAADGTAWSPHTETAWRVWFVSGGTAKEIVTGVTSILVIPKKFEDENAPFRKRVEQEIADIVRTAGDKDAVRWPDGQPVTSRIALGVVESLTGMPHPVPAGMRVFTVLEIDPAAAQITPTDTDQFIAAPVFRASNGGVYLPLLDPTLAGDEWTTALAEDPQSTRPPFATGSVHMHPTLAKGDLAADPATGRLLDLSRMFVLNPASESVFDEDWATELAPKLAEVIDPAARVMSIFDETVTASVSLIGADGKPKSGDEQTKAKALREKLAHEPERLLDAIDLLHWMVLGPRTLSGESIPAPAVTLIGSPAVATPSLWARVIPTLLAYADRAGATARPERTEFAAIARSRLAGLIGVPPDEIVAGALDTESIDDEGAFGRWVKARWLLRFDSDRNTPVLGTGTTRVLQGSRRTMANADIAVKDTGVPLIDFRTARDAAVPIVIPFELTLDPVAANRQQLECRFDVQTASGRTTLVVTVVRQGSSGTMTLTHEGDTSQETFTDVDPAKVSVLGFEVRFSIVSGADPLVGVSARVRRGGLQADAAVLAPRKALFGAATPTLVGVTNITSAGIAVADLALEPLATAVDPFIVATTARRDLSLTSAAPFIPGVLAGRADWTKPFTPPPADTRSAAERIRDAVQGLVGSVDKSGTVTLGFLYDATLAAVRATNPGPEVDALIKALFDAAVIDALDRLRFVVPVDAHAPSIDPTDRLTVDARPLVFRIDRLQAFTATDDLWSRLSGLGVFFARTIEMNDTRVWHSLNLATLHTPRVSTSGVRDALSEGNAVVVRDGGFPKTSIVDPVALTISENAGVRSVLMSYDNRSIVGEMASDARVQSEEFSRAPARRFEAYGFPPPAQSAYRLLALSFGYVYHVAPYVIGQGGVLPPAARTPTGQPNAVLELNKDDIEGRVKLDDAGLTDVIRSKVYLRTRPVGAPRIARDTLPGVPAGVSPLASELPVRAAPVTLEAATRVRFFLDKEGARGTIDMPPASGRTLGLRLEFAGLPPSPAGDLSVTLVGLRPGDTAPSRLELKTTPKATFMRLDVLRDQAIVTHAAAPEFAEDEPAFGQPDVITYLPAEAAKHVDEWRAIFVEVEAARQVDIEPPAATIVEQNDGALVALTRPLLPLEASPQVRSVHVLDGIGPLGSKRPRIELAFRRPSVDFSTYERWVNPPLIESTSSADDKKRVKAAINAARLRATGSPADTTTDRTCDDPAAFETYAEFIRVFPTRALVTPTPVRIGPRTFSSLDRILNPETPQDYGSRIDLAIMVDPSEGFTLGNTPTFRCQPGRIYEVRVYSAIADRQEVLTKKEPLTRFGRAAASLLRRVDVGTSGTPVIRRLGTPLTLTFEVATAEMPGLELDETSPRRIDTVDVSVHRPPVVAEERALIRLGADLLPTGSGTPTEDAYRKLRYVDRVAVLSQRWSWRGRPQADHWPGEVFATAFIDRKDEDVGDIIERSLTRSHTYAQRSRLADTPDRSKIPTVLEKTLDYRAGVNLWRFALRATSRYLSMRPNNPALVKFSHLRGNKPAAWRVAPVYDRPLGRKPKRPALALILPLTEPYMADGAVPPVMALFNDQMFAGYHLGDAIETSVEVARHPLPAAGGLKYWHERGPDPIRTEAAADGTPVALRTDGLLGYTFDIETEAGRFDHGALFISPVGQKADAVSAWSMVKLRFRRREAPEGLDPSIGVLGDGDVPPSHLHLTLCGPRVLRHAAYRLVNDRAVSAINGPRLKDLPTTENEFVFDGVSLFPTEHEGLVIDLPDAVAIARAAGGTASYQFSFHPRDDDFVRIDVKFDPRANTLEVAPSTHLGKAGSWTHELHGATAAVRIVLSARDKPQTGTTYRPAGDVVVHVRLTNNLATDVVERLAENRWLSVTSLPLTRTNDVKWELKIAEPVAIEVDGNFPEQPEAATTVRPVRASGFTPATWCQFAESMSVFTGTFTGGVSRPVPASELVASVSTGALTLALAHPQPGGSLTALAPIGTTDDRSQVEEVMFAVLTRYITDVFDRSREQPIAVFRWPDNSLTIDTSKPPLWPPMKTPIGLDTLSGRLRLVRVLRSRKATGGPGFEDLTDADTAPTSLFDVSMLGDPGGSVEMNPPDAHGIVLGISKPIEWQS